MVALVLSLAANITFVMVLGATRVAGDIVVVEDTTGQPHDTTANLGSVELALCSFAARGLYTVMPDSYDAVISFTTHPMTGPQYALMGKTPAGNLVRQTDKGVAYGGFLIRKPPSEYGSAATLKHCVYMGPTSLLPTNPDSSYDVAAGPFGGTNPSGVTGIELLGHEFGHHWMAFAAHDAADGRGLQALFRGDPRDPEQSDREKPAAAGVHYSHLANTHSVMYGNFITRLGGGMFRLEGGARKYGPMDQYLMGLRGAHETPPLLAIDDGSQRGLIGTPLTKGQVQVVSGTGVEIPVADVIRAIGPRVPAYPNAQRCFRMAFVLITHPGHTATAQEIALVDAYRRRWEQWFPWATDGRGATDTRLSPADPCPVVPVDVEPPGEGAVSGAPLPPPAVQVALPEPEPVTPMPEPMMEDPIYKLRPGCGCGAVEGGWLVAVLALALRGRRRMNGLRSR